MLELSPEALALFNAVPCNPYVDTWRERVQAFYAFMGEDVPGWVEESPAAENSSLLAHMQQWTAVLEHMFDHGVKFQIANCRSYWFLKRQTSKWAGIEGEHRLIELCYVSLFGDTFSGHATEYFPPTDFHHVRLALLKRVTNEMHCRESGLGYSVEGAIAGTLGMDHVNKEKQNVGN